ncbi:major facilitator transporter [Caballeronia calidae]|uniref:Major facilitator transporter n=1 Tax=Caballeronia calidae TaxID=1777139 RepID=A0A158A8F7_9BURK|nr:MFS transporter [Caballeronia calidae]SAK53896.1 major facilitator transporter [Caballeronia calidae]
MIAIDKSGSDDKISRMGWIVSVTIIAAMVVEGIDLQYMAMALPSLIKEFHLSNVQAGFLAAVTLAGQMAGGIVSGWVADRIGRAKVVAWGIAWFSVMTAALAFTRSFEAFAIVRFLGGVGLSAVYCVGIVFVNEYIPTKRRNSVLGLVSAGSPVGYAIAAVSASYVIPNYGWRPLFWVTALPAVATVFLLKHLEDPESWKVARQQKRQELKPANEWSLLFKDKFILKMAIAWSICQISSQAGYYSANNWMPTYLQNGLGIDIRNVGWFVAGNYVMMVFGKVLAGAASDRFGRKGTWVVSSLVTAIAFPLMAFYVGKDNVGIMLLSLGLFYGCPNSVGGTFVSESFPTRMRGTAVALVFNIGRIGGMVAPITLGYIASKYSFAMGLGFLGFAYIIAAISAMFIKEKAYDPTTKEAETIAHETASVSEPPSGAPTGKVI